jgi:hypothetical protein
VRIIGLSTGRTHENTKVLKKKTYKLPHLNKSVNIYKRGERNDAELEAQEMEFIMNPT